MKGRLRLFMICLLLSGVTRGLSSAQTMSPVDMIRQTLNTHIGPNGLPSDFVIQGQVTDRSGTQSLRMTVKGKNQIRYELTQGKRTNVTIYNAGTACAGPSTSLKPLMEHAAVHRPFEIPFLDVIINVGNPYWNVRYIGSEALGSQTVLHFAVHYRDSVPPQQRFLNRPLNEDAEFFVDAQTSLIVRSQRMQVANDSMDFHVPSILDFSDYRQVSGLMIP